MAQSTTDITKKIIVVLGPGAVGKSCLTIRFVQGKFVRKYNPTIEDFYLKQLDVDGTSHMLDILDTAGQDDFSALRDSYMQTGHGFVFVFSVDSRRSYDETKLLYQQLLRTKEGKRMPMVLVANKCDLEDREVTTQDGEALAAEMGCPYVEASAKENINVSASFAAVVNEIIKARTAIAPERKRKQPKCKSV